MGVRGYVADPLSPRHVEALMAERGMEVEHSTINRWVIKSSPQLEEACHRRKRPMWGCNAFEAAQATGTGMARRPMLRQGQRTEGREQGRSAAEQFYALAASSSHRRGQLTLKHSLSKICDKTRSTRARPRRGPGPLGAHRGESGPRPGVPQPAAAGRDASAFAGP